jgi:hypothetical protein
MDRLASQDYAAYDVGHSPVSFRVLHLECLSEFTEHQASISESYLERSLLGVSRVVVSSGKGQKLVF